MNIQTIIHHPIWFALFMCSLIINVIFWVWKL